MIKYPSFRIDDILNNDFGMTSESNNETETELDTKLSKLDDKYNHKFDQPINLSSIKYPKEKHFNSNLSTTFNLSEYENLNNENSFKNKSSISSSSPTLSVGSSDSPSFNQLSPTSKSPIIDQLIKCNLNEMNSLKTNLLNSPVEHACTDECNHNSFFNGSLTNSLLINQQYPLQSFEDFYFKLNKNPFIDKECLNKPFDSVDCDKSIDTDVSIDINDTQKIHQKYQTQLTKSTLLAQFQPYCTPQQNDQPLFTPTNNFTPSSNQPNSNFFMQQFYIRMKMLMQAKPRKGGQIRFNHQQTNELEAMFNIKKYLVPSERKQIAKKLSLSERQVKTWFQNRRAKSRRSSNYRS